MSADPLDALVAAVCPLFAGKAPSAPSWKLSGERLSDGTVRLTVRNVANSQTWQVDMSKAEARQLAAGLNASAGR